jgi:hypothetical protein
VAAGATLTALTAAVAALVPGLATLQLSPFAAAACLLDLVRVAKARVALYQRGELADAWGGVSAEWLRTAMGIHIGSGVCNPWPSYEVVEALAPLIIRCARARAGDVSTGLKATAASSVHRCLTDRVIAVLRGDLPAPAGTEAQLKLVLWQVGSQLWAKASRATGKRRRQYERLIAWAWWLSHQFELCRLRACERLLLDYITAA